jgi:hypothetical protein
MRTICLSLMRAATSAKTPGMFAKAPGQLRAPGGQDSQTASWGSHSAGIRNPIRAGVSVLAGIALP